VIETWARNKGVTIDERLVEVESGSEDERPVFRELWERVRAKRVGTICISALVLSEIILRSSS